MSEPVFEVTYRVGMGDLNAFFWAWWKRTRFDKANWKRFTVYALAIVGLLIFSLKSWISKSYTVGFGPFFTVYITVFFAVFGLLTALALTFVVGPLLTYLLQLAAFAFGPMRHRVCHLRATNTGLEKTSKAVESQTKWRDFAGVVDTRRTVLLFTNRNCATIIPKSAFASPTEAEAFAAFAKAQWEDARTVF